MAIAAGRSPSLRTTNLFNSLGLLAISVFLVSRVIERRSEPAPVMGIVPVVAGLSSGRRTSWAATPTTRIDDDGELTKPREVL
jgi:hypothetical protein